MLRKLMKYEIKATGRTLLPLYGVLLIFAIINKIFIGGSFSGERLDFLGGIPMILSIFAYGCTMAAVFIVTLFIIIQRFYKNLLGDEGYLMNTLPVEVWKNILSKLLIAMLWIIVSVFVAILSILIMGADLHSISTFFHEFKEAVSQAYSQIGINIYILPIEAILAGLSQIIMDVTLIYASISLGHLFNKRKILASFGAFIVLNIIMNTITTSIAKTLEPSFTTKFQNITPSSLGVLHQVILIALVINLVFFAIYFFITNYVTKNKLNLE